MNRRCRQIGGLAQGCVDSAESHVCCALAKVIGKTEIVTWYRDDLPRFLIELKSLCSSKGSRAESLSRTCAA